MLSYYCMKFDFVPNNNKKKEIKGNRDIKDFFVCVFEVFKD